MLDFGRDIIIKKFGYDINNVLIVKGNNGVNKEYRDYAYNDLKIEYFGTNSPCVYTKKYIHQKCSLEPFNKEQAEFETYLGKILNEKEAHAKAKLLHRGLSSGESIK